MYDNKKDPTRIAISVFIVATTLTLFAISIEIPSFFIIPAGTLLIGALVSSLFALLFILTKGYELRYKNSKTNFIDKNNYILYNLAMTAYVFVIAFVVIAFTHKYLKDISSAGNILGDVGIVILFITIVFIINGKDVVAVFSAVISGLKSRKSKKK